MRGSEPNNNFGGMSGSEQRERVRNIFMGLSAPHAEKQAVRELLNQVWVGGLYDGDATLVNGNATAAATALGSLNVASKQVERRDLVVRWLQQL